MESGIEIQILAGIIECIVKFEINSRRSMVQSVSSSDNTPKICARKNRQEIPGIGSHDRYHEQVSHESNQGIQQRTRKVDIKPPRRPLDRSPLLNHDIFTRTLRIQDDADIVHLLSSSLPSSLLTSYLCVQPAAVEDGSRG
jgi:hypothetical protein